MSSLLRKHRELNKKKNDTTKTIDNDGFPMVDGATIDVDDNQKLWGVGAGAGAGAGASASANKQNGEQQKQPTVTYAQPEREKQPPLSYDNYTFAPMPALPPNFVPISSCDELTPGSGNTKGNDNGDNTLEPPDFMDGSNSTTMKISSNFTKLIVNAKKVDMVRFNNNKTAKQRKNKNNNSDEIKMIIDPKDADEAMKKISNGINDNPNNDGGDSAAAINNDNNAKGNNNDLGATSVQKAQENLIQQLKQGLDFLTTQNRHLLSHGDSLTTQINKERNEFKAQLEMTQKELEERNFKLAVLEQHFMALNNPDNASAETGAAASPTSTHANASSSDSATTVTEKSVPSSSSLSKCDQDGDNSSTKIVKSSVSSSIVQIDKGYLTDLEKVAQVQRRALEKLEKENSDLSNKVKIFTVDLEKKERTINNLESSLNQGREARFGRKSGGVKSSHRRRNTESVIISTSAMGAASPAPATTGGTSATPSLSGQSDDEFSVSNASVTTASIAEEKNKQLQETTVNVAALEEEINKAVKEALEKKEKEHTSTMDVLSHQLDLKDKIIKRHEMKIYSLLNRKGDEANSTRQLRQVPQDVIIRNISVTNELMDTSIRKLEKMMDQLEFIEKEKRTDLADELSPIRRVATKVSLVHEEMKVSIKLIEQKIRNDVEKIKRMSEEQENARGKEDGDDEDNSGQTSGEDGDGVAALPMKSSLEDRISEVLTESMRTLKETETSVKGEIDALTEQLQKFEFELEGKQDTIEALELACSEHVQNCRKMQEEIEQLKLGMTQV